MKNRHFFMLIGAAAGLAVPLLRLLWRAYSSHRVLWNNWLRAEGQHQYTVYLCLAILGVAALAVAGYAIGFQNDQWIEESETARDSNIELSHQAATDPLTGLFNTRAIHERLEIELEDCGRSNLTCLLIDLDHFKRINDTHGHPFGDEVLVAVARVLKKAVRRMDSVGRLGGEEFVVIMPTIGFEQAPVAAERIRKLVEQEPIFFDGKQIRVTCSIGAAVFPSDGARTMVGLLKSADDALYRAKRAGRNRIHLYSV